VAKVTCRNKRTSPSPSSRQIKSFRYFFLIIKRTIIPLSPPKINRVSKCVWDHQSFFPYFRVFNFSLIYTHHTCACGGEEWGRRMAQTDV
jgi:hypothetical protein